MSVRPSAESPLSMSSPVVGESLEKSVNRPGSGELPKLPPGSWVTAAIDRQFPDRLLRRELTSFGPLNPENNGWVWPDRIRAGELVVLVGDGSTGKSTVAADWIARVTTGTAFPESAPQHTLPPSDVLVFNARDDFARKVIPGIEAAGGDVDRVIRASHTVLKHTKSQGIPPVRLNWANRLGPRVHLGDPALMNALYEYVFYRPTIRMVVIDQANLHLRCGSEREFETVIQGLASIAHMCEVAVVITMQPDAFRRGEGVSKYLQSRSLKECVHSVWRIAPPIDPEVPGRVLECLKISHGVADSAKQNWHLVQQADQRLQWNPAEGTELAPSKDLVKHRDLVRVREFLDQILLLLGGLAGWNVLVERAAQQGIQPGLLRQGLTYWNLPSLFEPYEGDLREIVGYPELVAARREELWAQQASAREALRAGRSPYAVGLASGVTADGTRVIEENRPKTSAEPVVSAASPTLPAAPVAGGSRFIKPEVGVGNEGGGGADLEGEDTLGNGVKSPASPPKKVA